MSKLILGYWPVIRILGLGSAAASTCHCYVVTNNLQLWTGLVRPTPNTYVCRMDVLEYLFSQLLFSCAATQHVIMFFVCVFVCLSHPNYGHYLMNLSQTRPNLNKFDHTKSIQANPQTKLKQTKHHHTNLTEQASLSHQPCFFVCVCLFFGPSDPHTNSQVHTQTNKPNQTKININGFGLAKSAA